MDEEQQLHIFELIETTLTALHAGDPELVERMIHELGIALYEAKEAHELGVVTYDAKEAGSEEPED